MTRVRTAVVGVGHLGKEHARILSELPHAELVGVVDVDPRQAEAVAERCGTTAYNDYHDLLDRVDAVSVAVPTTQHHQVASTFLRCGVAVLVEKPLASTADQGVELVRLSRTHEALLQVGHIERFNPAFEELVRRPFRPKFVTCERLGPFTGRSLDIGVVLDLMIHDLDVLLALVGAPLDSVEALGLSVVGPEEDVANARLRFANGCVAELSASRVAHQPVRQMQAWGPEGFASLDFARRSLRLVRPSDELRQQGLKVARLDPASRARLKDDFYGRYLQAEELECTCPVDQLTRELQEFIDCVRLGGRPRVTGEEGLQALLAASMILDSLQAHRWDGPEGLLVGPHQVPTPLGPLFLSQDRQAA